jgi:enoyl-CoA hydratase/3-hydroxyacyl-CoA dehydrogenase
VPDHELFDTALAWARRLAEKAPIAVEEVKQRSHHPDLDEGLGAEAQGFGRAFGSEDAKEGISAFLGKRRAVFKGR